MTTQQENYIESKVQEFIQKSQTDLEMGKITEKELHKQIENYRKELINKQND